MIIKQLMITGNSKIHIKHGYIGSFLSILVEDAMTHVRIQTGL